MPVEITSRIRRDELLQILETEAPVTNQRTTAPMPAVTLTDLLCIREADLAAENDAVAEPPAPPRRMRANTVPAPSRSPVRAVGTDPQLQALPPSAAPAAAVAPAEAPAEPPAVGRTSTYDTPALIVDRAPIFDLPAAEDAVVSGRAPTADTAPVPPFMLEEAARQLAQLITPDAIPAVAPTQPSKAGRVVIPNVFGVPIVPVASAEPAASVVPAAPVAAIADQVTAPLAASLLPRMRRTPPSLPTVRPIRAKRVSRTYDVPPIDARQIAEVLESLEAASVDRSAIAMPAPVVAMPVALAPHVPAAVTTEQLRPVSLRSSRPLVIAMSCLVTLVLLLLLLSLL